ncbi:MAG: hypothetical protein OEY45_03045 [Gammaproteobacteria bacterium]|nr:hypothetical protein [Gammaproteobacteria bacterium]MDH5514120.1 hypothetical protein [Gammaproteobacteria bacterium]
MHWLASLPEGGKENTAVFIGRSRRVRHHDFNTRAAQMPHPAHLLQRQ